MPPTSQFFQVPASGEFEKLEPVREHRQCLLFLSGKGFTFPAFREKLGNFLGKCPHRGSITLSTINITNSGERG